MVVVAFSSVCTPRLCLGCHGVGARRFLDRGRSATRFSRARDWSARVVSFSLSPRARLEPTAMGAEQDEAPEFSLLSHLTTTHNEIVILDNHGTKILLLDSSHNVHSMYTKENKWTGSYWVYNALIQKKKAAHKTNTTDDKQLQSTLKRIGVNTIPAIEEVNIFKDDIVIQFSNPKVQASIAANTWVVSGMPQTKMKPDSVPVIRDIRWIKPNPLVIWKKMESGESLNFLALTGPPPDLDQWAIDIPEQLSSKVRQWRPCGVP